MLTNKLPMNRKCRKSVTTDDRGTGAKVLGADKDKVQGDQTPWNNKWFHDCLTAVARSLICDLYLAYFTYYVFAQVEYIISCNFPICAISFVAFVRILDYTRPGRWKRLIRDIMLLAIALQFELFI